MLAALAALPELFKLLREIWDYVMKISKGDPATYFAQVSEAVVAAKTAKTEEDHLNAAKKFADAISRMPSH